MPLWKALTAVRVRRGVIGPLRPFSRKLVFVAGDQLIPTDDRFPDVQADFGAFH